MEDRAWKQRDDLLLVNLINRGVAKDMVGRRLGRTERAVQDRASVLRKMGFKIARYRRGRRGLRTLEPVEMTEAGASRP